MTTTRLDAFREHLERVDMMAQAEAALKGKQEQVQIVMRHKNEWMDRALNAEAELAETRVARQQLLDYVKVADCCYGGSCQLSVIEGKLQKP